MSQKHGVNAEQVEAVLSLDGPKRLEHFVKIVVDREEAWGLYCDGWASTVTETDERAFPLWPGRKYAQPCVADQ